MRARPLSILLLTLAALIGAQSAQALGVIGAGTYRFLDHGDGQLGPDYGLRVDSDGLVFSVELGGAFTTLTWGGGATATISGTLHDNATGDIVLFDSYVPHRSGANQSAVPRRALYVTYNPASAGDRRSDYFERKRRAFPPECERDPDAAPDPESAVFNLGNPIR